DYGVCHYSQVRSVPKNPPLQSDRKVDKWRVVQQNHSSFKNKVVNKGTEEEIIAPQSTRRKRPETTVFCAENVSVEGKMIDEKRKEIHASNKLPLLKCRI